MNHINSRCLCCLIALAAASHNDHFNETANASQLLCDRSGRISRSGQATRTQRQNSASKMLSANPLTMSVTLKRSGPNDLRLRIVLRNNSKRPFNIAEGFLPWGSAHSLLIFALKPTPARESRLNQVLYIDDPPFSLIKIKANQVLTGEISLTERFPTLSQVLRKSDVIIVWSYQPRPFGKSPLGRLAGCLLIRKQQGNRTPAIDKGANTAK